MSNTNNEKANVTCEFLNNRVVIVTENADGEIYVIKTDDVSALVKDWLGNCEFVPANDAKVYFAAVDGEAMNPNEYTDFESALHHIEEVIKQK